MIYEILKQALPILIPILIILGLMWRKMNTEFEKINKNLEKIREELKEIKKEITDMRERFAYFEAETIVLQTIPDPNLRSVAAKKSWERRKAKQIAKLEKK